MFAELPGSAKAFYNSIMVEFYSMYIDHYTIHGEETVLYCKP
jgi:hypothetical protein